MGAHAEDNKLLRSAADGKVFDLVPEVADRYLSGRRGYSAVRQGFIHRIQAGAPFLLQWTRGVGKGGISRWPSADRERIPKVSDNRQIDR